MLALFSCRPPCPNRRQAVARELDGCPSGRSTAIGPADALEGEKGHVPALHLLARPGPALAGEVVAVRATFDRAVAYVNHVGLLAEEVDVGGPR
jgi:hypothetical protein